MKKAVLVLLLLAAPFFTGCLSVNSYFTAVRNDIVENLDGNFIEDTEFSIGPVGLSMAGWFISSEEDPVAADLIEDLQRVQIGVYKRSGSIDGQSNYQVLKRIDKRMKKYGWRYIVKNCSDKEISLIYVNRNLENGIRKMFIVSLNNEELALVHLEGNLNRVVETAIHDRGLAYN
jgi:hypothetical protein